MKKWQTDKKNLLTMFHTLLISLHIHSVFLLSYVYYTLFLVRKVKARLSKWNVTRFEYETCQESRWNVRFHARIIYIPQHFSLIIFVIFFNRLAFKNNYMLTKFWVYPNQCSNLWRLEFESNVNLCCFLHKTNLCSKCSLLSFIEHSIIFLKRFESNGVTFSYLQQKVKNNFFKLLLILVCSS